MFNSYDKEKFVEGAEYYTFYMEESSKGTSIRNYTGIMKVKCTSNKPTKYSPEGYTEFDILESKKLGSTIAHNIHLYMDGYGCASCNFYDSWDEAAAAHDEEVKKIAKHQNTAVKKSMYKKLLVQDAPGQTKIEKDSVEWYNGLSNNQKKYVKWIKEYYTEV